MYAKLINETLIPAPNALQIGNKVHYHPSDELYRANGWLLVVEAPKPETDSENPKYYKPSYTEQNGSIICSWVETDPPVSDETVTAPGLEYRVSEIDQRVTELEENIGDSVAVEINRYLTENPPEASGVASVNGILPDNNGNVAIEIENPEISAYSIPGGHRISITDSTGVESFDVLDGAAGADGYTPVKGVDYYTDADKEEIVQAAIAELPTAPTHYEVWTFEVEDTGTVEKKVALYD